MSTTLSLDATGGLFVPAALLERAHLAGGKAVAVEVEEDRLVVKPTEAMPANEGEVESQIKLVRRGKFHVFTGMTVPFDAVDAVSQARDEREEQLLAYRTQG